MKKRTNKSSLRPACDWVLRQEKKRYGTQVVRSDRKRKNPSASNLRTKSRRAYQVLQVYRKKKTQKTNKKRRNRKRTHGTAVILRASEGASRGGLFRVIAES